ncbi:MAG: NUDIX domain-containing protein [Pedobacter sp.]|nr:MAG: NUDIX domain-containing protein [Pedobacter sp.]
MAQKYRIYINDNRLFITDHIPEQTKNTQRVDVQGFDFLTFYKNLGSETDIEYLLVDENPKKLFKSLKKKCTVIKAAGGLVKNSQGETLFIFRNKKWDLPKGKVEKREKLKVAAVREVEEECGVNVQRRGERLCKTYHIYELNGKVVLKSTSWYDMEVKGIPNLIPQTEEGITEAVWVAKADVEQKTQNTYPLIMEVLKSGDLI